MKDLLNKLKSEKKLLVTIAIFALFIYLDYSFVISMQLELVKNVHKKINKLELNIKNLNKELIEFRQIKQKQLKESMAIPHKKIISEEGIGLLLNDISSIANKHNVKIIQIKPTKDFAVKEVDLKSFKVLPLAINLDLFCSYHALGAFINDLENSEKFMVVKNMKITRQEDNNPNEKINLELKTYVKK